MVSAITCLTVYKKNIYIEKWYQRLFNWQCIKLIYRIMALAITGLTVYKIYVLKSGISVYLIDSALNLYIE